MNFSNVSLIINGIYSVISCNFDKNCKDAMIYVCMYVVQCSRRKNERITIVYAIVIRKA